MNPTQNKYEKERRAEIGNRMRLLALMVDDTNGQYRKDDDGAMRLNFIMNTEIIRLGRQRDRRFPTPSELTGMKEGVRTCAELLDDLARNEPEKMAGWQHGAFPKNKAYGLANLLSRLILEFSGDIAEVESQFPALKPFWDRERAQHARDIEEEDNNNEQKHT